MAVGKPINKSYYSASQGGGSADIAMPDMDQKSPIQDAAPNPWDNQPQQQDNALAAVPDELPEDVVEEIEQEEVQAPSPKIEDGNWKYMREARDKAERERDELLKLLMGQQQKQQPVQKEPEYEDDLDIEPDALVEGKNLKKLTQRMREMDQKLRDYEKKSHEQMKRSTESLAETRVKTQYPDFEKVVTDENLRMLKDMHPEIARSIGDTTDLYSQYASAYKFIKTFGIGKDEGMERDYMKAIKNINKPKPLASVNPQQGDSPLSKANAFANGEFTNDMKEKLRKEMFEARKRL